MREAADMPVDTGRLRILSRTIVRLAVLLAALLIVLPTPVTSAAAAPAYDESGIAGEFLGRLLEEINVRRSVAGTQRLACVPASAALDGFFAATVKANTWQAPSLCVASPRYEIGSHRYSGA